MNLYLKYIKYKNKYIALANKLGGSNPNFKFKFDFVNRIDPLINIKTRFLKIPYNMLKYKYKDLKLDNELIYINPPTNSIWVNLKKNDMNEYQVISYCYQDDTEAKDFFKEKLGTLPDHKIEIGFHYFKEVKVITDELSSSVLQTNYQTQTNPISTSTFEPQIIPQSQSKSNPKLESQIITQPQFESNPKLESQTNAPIQSQT